MKLKWFWRVYLAVVTLLLLGVPLIAFGPSVELAVAPVLTAQTISAVEREPGRLCWRWERVKRRSQGFWSPRMDVTVRIGGDSADGSIYNRDTGALWAKSGAAPPSTIVQNWCVMLPPGVDPATPIRVEQVAYYPGWLNLWWLPVRLPTVVDPAEDKSPP